jgi:hypothetical protein
MDGKVFALRRGLSLFHAGLFLVSVLISAFLVFRFAPSALALEVSPSIVDLALEEEGRETMDFSFSNTSDEDRYYTIDLVSVDLGASRDDISATPLDDALSPFLSVDLQAIALQEGEEATVSVSAHASSDLIPGSYVIGVEVTETTGAFSGVLVRGGFLSLIFLTVEGDITTSFTHDFYVDRLPGSSDIIGTFVVENTGDRILQPSGVLTVSSLFGKDLQQLQINPNYSRIPPGQVRLFEINFHAAGFAPLGLYQMQLEVVPWGGGESFFLEKRVFRFNWQSFAFVGIGFFALSFLVILRRRRSK